MSKTHKLHSWKRPLAVLLAVLMVLTLLPTMAFAADPVIETVYDMQEDSAIKDKTNGTVTNLSGADASDALIKSGNPTVTIVDGEAGKKSLSVTNRTANYFGIDIKPGLFTDKDAKYNITVTGHMPDGVAGTMVLQANGNKSTSGQYYDWLSNMDVTAGSSFTLTTTKSINEILQKNDGRDFLKFQIQASAENIDFFIDNIIITKEATPELTDDENATLISLTISPGTLTPAFKPNTKTYTAKVDNNVETITVNATTTIEGATIKIAGEDVASGGNYIAQLDVGSNVIEIAVTAKDGVTTDKYTLTVTREAEKGKAKFGSPKLGVEDELWHTSYKLNAAKSTIANNPDKSHATGDAYVLWDEDFLYVRVEVKDDDVFGTPGGSYMDDSIELFVGTGSGGANQWRISAGGTLSGQEAAGLEGWAKVAGDGYTVEMKIPNRTLNFTNDSLQTFEIGINNSTGAGGDRYEVVSWYGTPDTGYSSSASFENSLMLVDGPDTPRPLITATVVGNGTIEPSGKVRVTSGASQEFIITPAENHLVSELKVNGTVIDTVGSYTFTDVKADQTIAVTFKPDPELNPITYTAVANGGKGVPSSKIRLELSYPLATELKLADITEFKARLTDATIKALTKLSDTVYEIDIGTVTKGGAVTLTVTNDRIEAGEKLVYISGEPGEAEEYTVWIEEAGGSYNKMATTEAMVAADGPDVPFTLTYTGNPSSLDQHLRIFAGNSKHNMYIDDLKITVGEDIVYDMQSGSSIPAIGNALGGSAANQLLYREGATCSVVSGPNGKSVYITGKASPWDTATISVTVLKSLVGSNTCTVTVEGRIEAGLVDIYPWDLTIPSLYKTYEDLFLFGNIMEPGIIDNAGSEEMFRYHYNVVSAENCMKPEGMVNANKEYTFTNADKLVNWALDNNIKVHGHTLVWHAQTPSWLTSGLTRAEAKANLKAYINEVAGHYKGKVISWDVVNEAISGGSNSPWKLAYANGKSDGEEDEDYIYDAFMFTRQVDSDATLYYNDFNEHLSSNRQAIAAMVGKNNLRWANDTENNPQAGTYATVDEYIDAGGRLLIEGIGMQSHFWTGESTSLINNVKAAIDLYRSLGVKLCVTELDIPAGSGGTVRDAREEDKAIQAQLYKELFELYVENADIIERVTIWGRKDDESWRAGSGGAAGPVIFDANKQAKPAYYNIIDVAAAVATYKASVSPASKSWSANVGYSPLEAQVFTITKTGSENLTGLAAALADSTNFEISAGLSSTSVTSTATVSVKPKDGLPQGTYSTNLTINWNKAGAPLTVPLSLTVNATSGSTGGGGGSGSTTSNITITSPSNGKATASPSNPKKGDKVTLSVTPDSGYELDKITVTDKDGKTVVLTDIGNGAFTYTQPDGEVMVTATFKKIEGSTPTPTPVLTDIGGHWASDYIETVVEKGLFSGTSATTFSPNTSMTRAMFATVLSRLDGANTSGYSSSRFNDVPGGTWYTGGVEWAAENSIVGGIGSGNFDPNGNITREQMAVMLYRYLQYKGYDLPMLKSSDSFGDDGQISPWAKEAVDYIQRAGIITGKPGNLFDPKGMATRAEVAALFARFIEALEG